MDDYLYERNVRTRVRRVDPGHLTVDAHLADDTYGPGGFHRIHDMTVTAVVALDDMTLTALDAHMDAHPHSVCPATTAAVRALVGTRVAPGFNRAVRDAIGADRGCNHLHTLMQALGTIVGLSYAAVRATDQPEILSLSPIEFFRSIRESNPAVVGSCWAWAADGPVVEALDARGADALSRQRHDPEAAQ
jgi:hypothetical protein